MNKEIRMDILKVACQFKHENINDFKKFIYWLERYVETGGISYESKDDEID